MKTIFISYAVEDKERVKKIKRDLHDCGHIVWIYPQSIDPGEDIIKKEEEGIKESDVVLLMMSRHSKNSEAVRKEITLAENVEKITGKKKFYLINIDPSLALDDNTIQKCDLGNEEKYTSEFYRLLRKIETHKNYKLVYKKDEDEEDENWSEITIWVEGTELNNIKSVDYHIHSLIANDKNTKTFNKKDGKRFGIVFYTPHNEVVYAIITLKDGTTEELRLGVSTH